MSTEKKEYSVSDVEVSKDALLQKGYSAEDMEGRTFIIEAVSFKDGDMGTYVSCTIAGEDLIPAKKFVTGANNIVARLESAERNGKFPLKVTVVKHGRSYDIE